MKKKLFLAAVALVALASCTSDEFVGDQSPQVSGENGTISFNLNTAAVTRAGGSEAAGQLSNQFIIWGEKSESDGTAAATGNLVFKNYIVNYGSNTAYTTTSNTKDWEYVGLKLNDATATPATTTYSGNISPNSGTDLQTIKYWDYSAGSYTFTAVSALPDDITNGRVKITKTESGTTKYDKGYSIALNSSGGVGSEVYPQLDKIYFADRNVITDKTGADRTAVNAYGGNVTLTFRNLVSQIRAGVYETINGYDITEIKFYVTNDAEAKVGETSAFGAICDNTKVSNYTGTLTVTYYTNEDGSSIENQPKVTATGDPATDLILGTNMSTLSTSKLLGKTSTSPTWDNIVGSESAYTEVLPQIDNNKNLKLKVNYKLWNSVTNEVINVTGATAEIPAEYLRWKPNYRYTYLFKISDNSNGQTGTGTTPAGLYPITFDALVMEAEDGKAEYITTVSEPSITTFGVKGGKYSVGKNEYEAGSDIYVAFVDGSTVQAPNLGDNVNVYKATTADKTNYPITEASVAESLAEISTGAKKITVTNINSGDADYLTSAPIQATEVPGEDGVNISIKFELTAEPTDWDASDANVYYSDAACTQKVTTAFPTEAGTYTYYKKWTSALKLTGVKATTATGDADKAIVVEYVKTSASYNTTSETHTFADASALSTWEASNYKLYTDADGTIPATTASGTEVTYYKRTSVKNVGVYAYKVIHVEAAPSGSR